MARSFNGTTQYLECAGAAISSGAATFAGWIYLEASTDLAYGPAVYNSSANNFWHIRHVDTQGWGAVRASGANVAYRLQGSNSTVGWHHVCGTWAASSSALPSLYVDGVSITGTTLSATVTPSVDRTGIQTSIYSGRGYGKGRNAEQAIWAAELSAAEAVALYRGFTPLQIRPASLVAYWPLGGHYGQLDVDRWKNRYDLTPTGSPTWADHPRVIYPRRSFWFPSPIVASTTVYTLEASPATIAMRAISG